MAAAIVIMLIFTTIITYFPGTIEYAYPDFEYCNKLFNKDEILNIEIKMDKDDLNDMFENALKEEYHKCDVSINRVKFKNVGVRTKGNTSLSHVYSSESDRFSLRLNFNKYVNDQTCYGLDDLALNNLVSDATYIKEYLTYDMFEYIGAKAPLCNMCTLRINGKNRGVYAAIEVPNKSFLKRNFGNDYGKLYKPETMGGGPPPGMEGEPGNQPSGMEGEPRDLPPEMNGEPGGPPPVMGEGSGGPSPEMGGGPGGPPPGMGESSAADLKYIDNNEDSYSILFDAARTDINDDDKKRLILALKNITEKKNLKESLYIEDQLKYIIVNAFVTNSDGYFGHMLHNYYLYEKNGKLMMLPWDYNLAFGGFERENASNIINMPIDDPIEGQISIDDRPMIDSLLNNDVYLNEYHEMFSKFIKGYFESGRYEKVIDNIDNLISDYVEKDPTAFYSYTEYKRGIYVLKQFCKYRSESIRGQFRGEIAISREAQQINSDNLINTDDLDLSEMGVQNNPGGPGGPPPGMNGQNNPGGSPPEMNGQNNPRGSPPEMNGQNYPGGPPPGMNGQGEDGFPPLDMEEQNSSNRSDSFENQNNVRSVTE